MIFSNKSSIVSILFFLLLEVKSGVCAKTADNSSIIEKSKEIADLYKSGQLNESINMIDNILSQAYIPNLFLLKCEIYARLRYIDNARACLDFFEKRELMLDEKQLRKIDALRSLILPIQQEQIMQVAIKVPVDPRPSSTPGTPVWRRPWFIAVMASSATALTVGLSLGLIPRRYESVEWQH